MSPEEQKAILSALATHCVARMEYQGMKGKRPGDAVMDFYAGACALAAVLGSPIYKALAVQAILRIATRGFDEVQKIAKEHSNVRPE